MRCGEKLPLREVLSLPQSKKPANLFPREARQVDRFHDFSLRMISYGKQVVVEDKIENSDSTIAIENPLALASKPNIIPISNGDYLSYVSRIKRTRKLPEEFFDTEGQLKDLTVVHKTLVRLAEDLNYVGSLRPCRQKFDAGSNSTAATLARILLNSIPGLSSDINKRDWADDPLSPQYRPENHIDWEVIHYVLGRLHDLSPSDMPKGVTTSRVNKIRDDIRSSPLFYIANSALRLLGSEETAPIFIRFINNLKLNVNIRQKN